MVVIVDIVANIVWVGYLFCAFKASFNYYQKLLDIHHHCYINIITDYNIIFEQHHILVQHYLNYLNNIQNNYYQLPLIYHFNMIYLEIINIYCHIKLFIYSDNLQFIITDYILYLIQPFYHSIISEYVNIIWH